MLRAALLSAIVCVICQAVIAAEPLVRQNPDIQEECVAMMRKVCDWQLRQSNWNSNNNWQHGALFTGIMATYETTRDRKYLDAARAWAEKFRWELAGTYPTRHADRHCCAQTYLELYFLDDSDANRYHHAQITNNYMIDNPVAFVCASNSTEWWSWCDALFMAPPVLPRLTRATGDYKYIDLMHEMWADTQGCLYDTSDHLFYRDHRFFDDRSPNGENVYWSRGNGWVIGGLVRVLQYLPIDDPKRERYVKLFEEMSARLAEIQPEDGYWRSNLLDANHHPNPETSGTGFFCYALAWGINQGILDEQTYLPVVERAWDALVAAVREDGKLGWVQAPGAAPGPTNRDHSEVYGVGAYLLAGSEIYKFHSMHSAGNIDHFEMYAGTITGEPGLLDRWSDGSANGSQSTIRLGNYGNRFMEFHYANDSAPYYSKADLVYDSDQDWTAAGAESLSIWCKGDRSNAADDIYVELEDGDANATLQWLLDDDVVQSDSWVELNFDLGEFAGVDLTRLRRMSIGVGSESGGAAGTGSGTLRFDNIRLYQARCLEREGLPDVDDDCAVNMTDFARMADDWLIIGEGYVQPVFPEAHRLRGHWTLDESSGTTAYDSSTPARNGRRVGASWAPSSGRYGGAARFGDNRSNRIEIPTSVISLSAGSVCLWGKVQGPQLGVRYFFGHTTIPTWNNRIQLYMDGDNTNLDLGLGNEHRRATNIVTLQTDTWYHIALTWERPNYVVYVDGNEEAAGVYSGLNTLGSEAHIGNNGSRDPQEALNGFIDDVRIYEYALSINEVMSLADSGGYCAAPLRTDLNKDCSIDFHDLVLMMNGWLQTGRYP
ncbi:MAG: glycoside hydrolase family 88 protein [Planctomycetota bacterium]|jgi:rhamnogalacturonyl hydrolase YesR